ncbi:MAG: two component transcriptional regulator, LuxR family [Dehalococcoidia bacterium]|nr:two component transcriptional regulator, LuxR family [Dehalococcoidia bacterium]
MAEKIRVLIVDDHALLREGIRTLVGTSDDIEIVGEAANGREAVEKARLLAPEVVLMDLAMPEVDGIEATKRLIRENPQVKVLAMTQSSPRRPRRGNCLTPSRRSTRGTPSSILPSPGR